MSSLLHKSFNIGLVSLALAFLLAFGRMFSESALSASFRGLLNTAAIVCFVIFMLCGAMLWIESLVSLVKQWGRRHIALNLTILVLLVVGHVVSAYVLHGIKWFIKKA